MTSALPQRRNPMAGNQRRAGAGATLAACVVVALIARPSMAQAPQGAAPATAVEVRVTAINGFDHRDPSRRQFGLLEFRGGLVLTSPFKEFGGFSSLRMEPDGAHFLTASYDGIRPTGIVDAEMAPMLGPDGKTLAARGWYDTESIAQDGGTLYVGIERVNRIVRFDYGKDGLLARAYPIEVPPGLRTLPYNKGVESLVFIPRGSPLGGTLMAISEGTPWKIAENRTLKRGSSPPE